MMIEIGRLIIEITKNGNWIRQDMIDIDRLIIDIAKMVIEIGRFIM